VENHVEIIFIEKQGFAAAARLLSKMHFHFFKSRRFHRM